MYPYDKPLEFQGLATYLLFGGVMKIGCLVGQGPCRTELIPGNNKEIMKLCF